MINITQDELDLEIYDAVLDTTKGVYLKLEGAGFEEAANYVWTLVQQRKLEREKFLKKISK
jgi:hypothetical protein